MSAETVTVNRTDLVGLLEGVEELKAYFEKRNLHSHLCAACVAAAAKIAERVPVAA